MSAVNSVQKAKTEKRVSQSQWVIPSEILNALSCFLVIAPKCIFSLFVKSLSLWIQVSFQYFKLVKLRVGFLCQGRGEGGNEKLRCVCFENEYQECRDQWAGCYFSQVARQTDCLHLRLLNSIHQPIRAQMHVALTNQRSGLLGSPGDMCECWHWVDMEVWGVMAILTVNTALPGPRLVRCQQHWPLIGGYLCLSHGSLECIHGPALLWSVVSSPAK